MIISNRKPKKKEPIKIDWEDPEVQESIKLVTEAISKMSKELTEKGFICTPHKGWIRKSLLGFH